MLSVYIRTASLSLWRNKQSYVNYHKIPDSIAVVSCMSMFTDYRC